MRLFWTKLKLRNKFLIPMVLLILISMGASAAISFSSSKKALADALMDNIQKSAGASAEMLDGWLKDRGLDLQIWSKQKVYLAAVQNSFLSRSAKIAANKQLAGLSKNYGYYRNICLASEDGQIVSAADMEALTNTNVKEMPFFQRLTGNSPEMFAFHLRKNEVNGLVELIFAARIAAEDQQPGVLFSIIEMEMLHALFIDKIKFGESGFAYIYRKDGLVIGHPRRNLEMFMNIREFSNLAKNEGSKKGVFTFEFEGKSMWAAYSLLNSIDWGITVTADKAEILAPTRDLGQINLAVLIVSVLIAGFIILFVSNSVVRPINQVVAGLSDAVEGEGDLTKRLEVTSEDEVGDLADRFNVFVAKMQNIIKDVAKNAGDLNQASQELSGLSSMLSSGADEATERAQAVASASEEMSANMNLVASTMDEASSNINMVASATEEISVTISEISQNTEKARGVTNDAVGHAQTASGQVDELGTAAQEIGKVVETITDISEQVNLLALNATIEAARAGEAGKGFAVVANEIKALAQQTASATGEIKRQVLAIQSSTKGTVVQIDNITGVVNKVDDIVSKIAAAVEDQSMTTKEIAGNVAQASGGIGDVNTSVGQSTTVAAEIASQIAEVTQAAGNISNSSSQVNLNSEHLATLAAQLNEMVGRFKI